MDKIMTMIIKQVIVPNHFDSFHVIDIRLFDIYGNEIGWMYTLTGYDTEYRYPYLDFALHIQEYHRDI